jgi:hypothetical protein
MAQVLAQGFGCTRSIPSHYKVLAIKVVWSKHKYKPVQKNLHKNILQASNEAWWTGGYVSTPWTSDTWQCQIHMVITGSTYACTLAFNPSPKSCRPHILNSNILLTLVLFMQALHLNSNRGTHISGPNSLNLKYGAHAHILPFQPSTCTYSKTNHY